MKKQMRTNSISQIVLLAALICLGIASAADAQSFWFPQSSGSEGELHGIDFINASNAVAVGGLGVQILRTDDAGTTWAPVGAASAMLSSVDFAGSNGIAVGDNGTITTSPDGGVLWVAETSPTSEYLRDVIFASPTRAFAVGNAGTILRTDDRGENWVFLTSSTMSILWDVHFSDPQTGVIVGDTGTILRTDDGGDSWFAQASGTTVDLHGVFFVNNQIGIAVGNAGTVLRTIDGGSTWTTQTTPVTDVLWSVSFGDSLTGKAVGDAGTIIGTVDGGSTWISDNNSSMFTLFDVHMPSANTASAVGAIGTIRRTESLEETPDVNLEIAVFNGPVDAALGEAIGDSISLTIRNSGSEPVSGDYSLGVYISSDAVITTSDIAIDGGEIGLVGLGAGQDSVIMLPAIAAISSGPTGNVYLGVIVDRFDDIVETNEFDNTAFQPILVNSGSDVDLTISAFSGPPMAFTGSAIGASTVLSITNAGTLDIVNSFDVDLLLSADATITPADNPLTNGSITIPNLGAGQTFVVAIPDELTLPFSPTGNVYLGVIVDASGTVAESNEGNNTSAVAIAVDADSDGDGVSDLVDAAPSEDASFFDRDGDGAIDDIVSARHLEYWDALDFPLPYVIHEEGANGIGDGSDFTAIQAGMNAWTTLPNTEISVNYGGPTTQKDAQALDGINIVTFQDPDFIFPAGVLAVGISTSFIEPTYFDGRIVRPGQLVDADMIFNPIKNFSTPSAGSGTSIQAVATHEAGHLFGFSHSSVVTSSMFFVLPPAVDASTLELEDVITALKGYPDATALATESRLAGQVLDGLSGLPVPGAIVFVTDASTGDTVGCDYTLPAEGTPLDGTFEFLGLPTGEYYVSIHPLNGSSAIGFIGPENINQLIFDEAVTLFVPEYYDLEESNDEDPTLKAAVSVAPASTTNIVITTNIDNNPPFVVAISPDSNVTDVAVDAAVLIKFSEPIELDSLPGNFKLSRWEDGNEMEFISGNAAAFDDDSTLAFIPGSPLMFESIYQLWLGTGLSDKFGNGLAQPFAYFFETEMQPPVFVSSLAPSKGVEGAVVVIGGFGFEADPMNNTVDFNGFTASIIGATPTELVVNVPIGATTGLVTVTNNLTSDVSPGVNFTVLAAEEVPKGFEVGVADLGGTPRSLSVTPAGNYAFVATDVGGAAVVVDPGSAEFLDVTSFGISGGLNELDATPSGNLVFAVSRVNEKLYRINANPVTGIGVLNEISIGSEPRGIHIDPSGRRAYIPTAEGIIEIWDINQSSATFEQPIGSIISPDPNLRGKLTTDPAGNYLLALTGTGKLLVFDLGPDTLRAEINVGSNPRDVVVDKVGQRAYVTDENGFVSAVSLSSFSHLTDISTGGVLRGIDMTPAGSFVYAVNRELNFLDVIDLRVGSPTFFGVATNVPHRVNPVDVEISPDGTLALSLSEFEQRLVVTAIGIGPTLNSLSRRAGPEGTMLVLAGEGFAADSSTTVSFNGAIAFPSRRADSSLTVTVPVGAMSGPVTVLGENPTGPVLQSNTIFFEVLGPTPSGGLRLAAKSQPPGGPELALAMAVSPLGDVVAVADIAGLLHVLDSDPSSPTFNQFMGFAETSITDVADIVITPDGTRAYMVQESNSNLPVVDVDRNSGTFLNVLKTIDAEVGDSGPTRLAMSPDGYYLYIADPPLNEMQIMDIRPGSPMEDQVIRSVGLFNSNLGISGLPQEIAVHPGGEYAYVAIIDVDPAVVYVIDVNPASGNFADIEQTIFLPGSVPTEVPIAMSFTPDGNQCVVMTTQISGINNRSVVFLDTSIPNDVDVDFVQSFGGTTTPRNEFIHVSPKGDRAVLNITNEGFFHIDIDTIPATTLDQSFDFLNLATVDFGYSTDGSRLYAASTFRDSVFVYDFTLAETLVKVSGDLMSGVVNQPLPAPLKVKVENVTSGLPVAGVAVTFNVTAGGGNFTTDDPNFNPVTQTVATDTSGVAQVDWQLGSTLGENSQIVQVTALGLSGSPTQFTASTVDDPNLLPLELLQVIPVLGTTDVSITTAVQTTFSRGVDPATITTSSFFLRKSSGLIPVPAVVGVTDADRKLSLTPVVPLEPSTEYVIEITGDLMDTSGNNLQNPVTSSFTTAAPPPLVVHSVAPPAATVGVSAVLSGTGFNAVSTNNTVLFNDEQAVITDAGDDFLDVVIPPGAESGLIRVVVGADTSNAIPFTVLVPEPANAIDDVVGSAGTGSSARSLVVTPDGAMAYAVSPDAGTVIPIEIDNLNTLDAIPVGNNPFAIAINPDGTYAYVTNLLDGTVSIIDVDRDSPGFNTVSSTVTVGTGPVDLLVIPDGDRVIVANEVSQSLSVIDSDSLSETFHLVLGSVGTGASNRTLAVTPDGGLLYVGTDTGYLILDALDFGVVGSAGNGSSTRILVVTPDGSLLIQLTTEGDVFIYDIQANSPTENQVVGSVGKGSSTRTLTVSPDGSLLVLVEEENDIILLVPLEAFSSVSVLESNPEAAGVPITLTPTDTIMAGEDPVMIRFDPTDPDRAVVTNAGDNTVTVFGVSGQTPAITADLRMFPRILVVFDDDEDLRWWQVRHIRAWIELPPEYDPRDIDVSSVRMQGVVPVEADTRITDVDWDGIEELRVKFDRVAFEDVLPIGWVVPVTIGGDINGEAFMGEITILTIRPLIHFPKGGEILSPGSPVTVQWSSPEGYDVDSVDVHFTPDDGETWIPIAQGIPDVGQVDWTTPDQHVAAGRVLVTLFSGGRDIGSGMSPGMFSIEEPLAVTLQSFAVAKVDRSAKLEWVTIAESGVRGFDVLRSESEEFGYEPINTEVIPSIGRSGGGATYEFADETVRPNRTYYYKLLEVSERGGGQEFGPYEFTYRAEFALEQNAPNPFNPTTTIRFTVAEDGFVNLAIFDVAGRRVRSLVSGEMRADHYEFQWDGRDAHGRTVASGVYFYRIEAGSFRQTKKMIMLK